ncbi:MAG: hypothetical protein GY940_04530 [bacterium]|nr:hypothetical protein [bacterium]
MIRKSNRVLGFSILIIMLLAVSVFDVFGSQSQRKKGGGPMPAPSVEGLPEFLKLLVFARQNISEGDFGSALENLEQAKKIHPKDPFMFELFGLAYDGDRNAPEAQKYFLKAGKLFLKIGEIDKALTAVRWLNTINAKAPEVIALEKEARKRQAEARKKEKDKKNKKKEGK